LRSKEKISIIVFIGGLDYTSNLDTLDKDIVMGISVKNKSEGVWGRVLSGILVLAILGTLGTLAYSIAKPFEEPFTEFYLLGLSGKANDYPGLLNVGEEGKVRVGIINREYEAVTYQVEVRIGGIVNNEVGPVMLEHDERWEEVTGFTLDRVGDKQKVEFLLYKEGQGEAYRMLELPVDVK